MGLRKSREWVAGFVIHVQYKCRVYTITEAASSRVSQSHSVNTPPQRAASLTTDLIKKVPGFESPSRYKPVSHGPYNCWNWCDQIFEPGLPIFLTTWVICSCRYESILLEFSASIHVTWQCIYTYLLNRGEIYKYVPFMNSTTFKSNEMYINTTNCDSVNIQNNFHIGIYQQLNCHHFYYYFLLRTRIFLPL